MKRPTDCINTRIYEVIIVALKYKYVKRVGGTKIIWEIKNWKCYVDLSFYGALYIAEKNDCSIFGYSDQKIVHPFKDNSEILGVSSMWYGAATFALIRKKRKPLKAKFGIDSLPHTGYSVEMSFNQANRIGKIVQQHGNTTLDIHLKDQHMWGALASVPKGYKIVKYGIIREGDYSWEDKSRDKSIGFWSECTDGGMDDSIGQKIEQSGWIIRGKNKAGKEFIKMHVRFPSPIIIRKLTKTQS